MTSRKQGVQKGFSDLEYVAKKKATRRDRFLVEIEPYCLRGERRGRPPIGLDRMLRMYIAQQCFGLSDEDTEDAIYDSQAIRAFVGIDFARELAPDAMTLLRFRRLLEEHQLTARIFVAINTMLALKGLILKEGTVVDASIIAVPSSTKNQDGQRDSEMHQTKKGNQWHFGMKVHLGVDAQIGIIHTVVTTLANNADITQAHALRHGEEKLAFGDAAGYQGIEKREEYQGSRVRWRPGKQCVLPKTKLWLFAEQIEQAKAGIRARVEHPFLIVKNLFSLRKVRYRGLLKNTAQLFTLFGLVNLLITKRRLFAFNAQGAS